jgi:protein transport protein SEC20
MDRPFSRQNKTLSKEEKEVHASSDVTLALRRTHEMMAGELQKSQFAHETLKQSTETLAQLSENYSTLDTLLSSSKNLLGTLLTSQKSDTWYLESAFYILICTISWLVFRRFFYGPLWWLVYAPLKLSFSTLFGIVGLFGSKGGSAVESGGPLSGGKNGQNIASSRIENARLNNEDVPVIKVGSQSKPSSGRKGASQDAENPTASTVTEEVERIIDRIDEQFPEGEDGEVQPGSGEFDSETGSEGYLSGDGKAEARVEGNPKRRMWEEPQAAVREEQRVRDEL